MALQFLTSYSDDEVTQLITEIDARGSLLDDQFKDAELSLAQVKRIWATLAVLAEAERSAGRAPKSVPFRVGRITSDQTPAISSVDLRWEPRQAGERFVLRTPIAYPAGEYGLVLVPDPYVEFETDLTSVPALFTWLVPRTGPHLAAALIHDGLVCDERTFRTYVGPDVSRPIADDNFRDHMRDLGVGGVRRWLMWTAVAIATIFSERRLLPKVIVALTIGVISTLGILATVDIFDCAAPLPWMGDHSVWYELFFGGLFAFVIPLVLAMAWLPFRRLRAGLILGWSLAFLLHVTMALVLLVSLYTLAERSAWTARRVTTALGGVVLAGVLPAVLALVLCLD